MNLFGSRTAENVAVYCGAALFGYVAYLLAVPLPWMIGPMVFSAGLALLWRSARVPRITRPIGQMVVASVVGLSFTAESVTALGQLVLPMVLVALLTIVAGFIAAAVLMRLADMDVVAAGLASIPGGPVEMAALAEHHNVPPAPIALAQTLRISLLVLIIPPVLVAISGGAPNAALTVGERSLPGMLLLFALAVAGGLLFRWLRITSPFFLGALGFNAAATAFALPVSMPPYWVLAGAQILLGVWLGCMFDRETLARTRAFVLAAIVSTGVLIVLCAGMAFAIAAVTGIDWHTMILATAPGSVTEMALTAKILNQQVAIVTAFHIVRIFIILPFLPLIFSVTAKLANRSR
nr:MAG: ammonia monooxygenase [Pseudomonadota bacterium]